MRITAGFAHRLLSRPKRVMNRLVVRIYLAVLASLLVFALLVALSWKLVGQHREENESRLDLERVLIDGLATDLFPAEGDPQTWLPALTRWSERLKLQLSIHDSNGQAIAYVGDKPVQISSYSLRAADRDDIWEGLERSHRRLTFALPGGRYLGVSDPSERYLRSWRGAGVVPVLGGLVMIGLAVGIAAWPLTRRITRRLERLEVSVREFGGGDLTARTDVKGRDEVASLAKSFNRSADQVEQLVQAQKSLLANASHELRSPLARIRMASALLESRPNDPKPMLAEMSRSVTELDVLVDEILLASRLDAEQGGFAPGDMPEVVDLGGLVAEETARVGVEAQAGALEIHGDRKLLRRLIRNLLENALRYGRDEGGDVDVQVSLGRNERDQAVLRVCDRGPGVPEGERDRIFEPFYRAKGRSEKSGGVGLGLALVRRIARRHGGDVRCEPRVGGGSCFVATLVQRPSTGSESSDKG